MARLKHPFEGNLSAKQVFFWVMGVAILEWINELRTDEPMNTTSLLVLGGGLAVYAVIDHLHAIRNAFDHKE